MQINIQINKKLFYFFKIKRHKNTKRININTANTELITKILLENNNNY